MNEYTIHPDSGLDFASEVQQALDSGKTVRIPGGNYLVTSPIVLPSGARIIAESEAVIRLGDSVCRGARDFLLRNANPDTGNTDISVYGGIWDGNNAGNPRPDGGLFAQGYTGGIFHFENVTGLRIEQLCMQNAEAYHVRITGVTQFHIEGISFDSDRVRPNNDGIHLGGDCSDGTIRDIRGLRYGVTGDDLVALNADDGLDRNEVRGMRAGPIRRVRIEKLRAEGTHCFVRLLSVFSPIEDIHIEDIEGTTRNTVINCDGCRRCRVTLFDPDAPPFPDGIGTLRNITIRSLRVGPAQAGDRIEATAEEPVPLFRLESRCANFSIEDFTRTGAKAATETDTEGGAKTVPHEPRHETPLEARHDAPHEAPQKAAPQDTAASDTRGEPTFAVAYLPGTRVTVDHTEKDLESGEMYRSWTDRIERMTVNTPGI